MNFIETISSIFVLFRLYEISANLDIRRVSLQISLNENNRNFLRFLLHEEENYVKTYKNRQIVFFFFPVIRSPFQLMAVIQYHSSKETFKLHSSEELLENS